MTRYKFNINGSMNTDGLDDAMDMLKLVLEDNGINVEGVTIYGGGEEAVECKKK